MTDSTTIVIVRDADDLVANATSVNWAVEELAQALARHGLAVGRQQRLGGVSGDHCILVAGGQSALASQGLRAVKHALPATPEALALVPTNIAGRRVLLAAGNDARGLTYAVLELADRAAQADGVEGALRALFAGPAVIERPANRIRSVMRLFTSDVEDTSWYHDRTFWTSYLSMLATQRFNRFQLAFGIGFDFPRHVRDSYFYFPYPFLLSVPGYDVRAGGVPDEERDRNLATLRFIAAETKRRGLHFQLGLWAHVYDFQDSPDVNHPIIGLRVDNHAVYCRDSLATLLQACPDIDGLTFRVHGESGIPEGNYEFWRTIFAAVAGCGRPVEIDMHAKGIDQGMIDVALATQQPVMISPKFWAEHLGLPYHQTDIRAVERPGPATGRLGQWMALSAGSRRFTRYGYADLLAEDRPHGVLFRIWPGTQRLLLWGDPAMGAAYSRAFQFCNADGVELFEPLSFSGRRGSGLLAGRDPYLDGALRPSGANATWEKYRYTYRLWGRLLYNPDADPEIWRRALRRQFGPAAAAMEAALASASRILPLLTTAHLPSAPNNAFWPEVYTDMPIVDETLRHPYGDTPSPKRFGTVSPLDPELFSSVEEFVDELLSGAPSGRYSPLAVAGWLDALATAAMDQLAEAERQLPDHGATEFRRWAIDVRVEAALGHFYAGKLSAAVGYALFQRRGDRQSLHEAVVHYRAARATWAEIVELTRDVYKPDLTFGPEPHLRGHWTDRLTAIDQDVQAMTTVLDSAAGNATQPLDNAPALTGLLRDAKTEHPSTGTLRYAPPEHFTPGEALAINAAPSTREHQPKIKIIRLHYRHVNQAERFQVSEMQQDAAADGTVYQAEIPADYTRSPFALQYYFEVHDDAGRAWLWPGFTADRTNQPYVVIRAQGGDRF